MKKQLTTILLFAATGAMAQKNTVRLDSLVNEKDPAIVQQRIQKLAAGNEQDLGVLLQFYIARKDVVPRDSLLAAIVQQYPRGWHAGSVGMSKVLEAKGGALKEKMYADYRVKFPDANFNKILFSIANAYAEERQTKKSLTYLGRMKAGLLRISAGPEIAEQLLKYDSKSAEALVKKELAATEAAYLHPDTNLAAASQMRIRGDYYRLKNTYGKILMQRKDNVAALQYIREAYDSTAWKEEELIRNYALLLGRNGKYEEAFSMLDNITRTGNGDKETKKELVIAYEKLNPGKKADAYLAEVQLGLQEKIRAKVATLLINEAAPAFEVKDVNGKTVSLADFKGKTIVLDFWATWCGPCKKSFPAMQQAVNAYRKNDHVKFLFIHTWEKTETPQEDALDYLKGNNFTFDLYMDTKDPVTKTSPAVTLFGVKGIPAKFVIDGDGNIRFKMTGFSGGDDAAVAELSVMIEMAAGKKKS